MKLLDRVKPIQRDLASKPQKWWATTGAIAVFGLSGVGVLASMFSAPPMQTVEAPSENKQISMYADTMHPLANLGEDYELYASANSSQKLDLVFQALENFDYWLKPRIQTAMDDALAKEALRMQEFARKEAASGKYVTEDAIALFDFQGCLASLPGDRCVLLRYAGEGIQQYALGADKGDAYEMSAGYLRMRAALLALGEFAVRSNVKEDVPLSALANYRQVIYQGLKLSPAAIAPVEIEVPDSFGSTTPAEALENAYPQDRSSEPVGGDR